MSKTPDMYMSFMDGDNRLYYMKGTSDDDCLEQLQKIYPNIEFNRPRVISTKIGKN